MCIAEIIFKQKKLKERVTINLTYCGLSQHKCSLFQVEIFEHNSGRDKKKRSNLFALINHYRHIFSTNLSEIECTAVIKTNILKELAVFP